MKKWIFLICLPFLLIQCKPKDASIPVIGFADAFEDETIGQAKKGFIDALQAQGYDESKGNVKIIYRNAQGSIPTLTQIVKYFISLPVTLLATCPSITSITAAQNTKDIPIFMMVAPTPELMKMNDAGGMSPKNLLGVSENLAYIDTSFLLIPKFIKPKSSTLNVGMLYNQAEPQSVDAMNRIKQLASSNGINLVYQSVYSTADVQLTAASLLSKGIDVFFANPDNVVFGSFETILQACNQKNIPIFTSEAGLVQRGALAAYGADLYQWGYQTGLQAATFLKNKSIEGMNWEMVKVRKRVYNKTMAEKFNLVFPAEFEALQ